MKVAFRANGGGGGIGLGHLMRCIALANAFQKREVACWFVCKDYPAGVEVVRKFGYEVKILPEKISLKDDLEKSLELMADADIIIADSYEFDSNYLKGLSLSGKFVVYVDDQMDRSLPVDAVIGNAYATRDLYGSNLAQNVRLIAGPHYLPLREEFEKLPPHQHQEKLQHILITMGGEDPSNVTKKLTEFLSSYSHSITIHILVGPAYSHRKSLDSLVKNTVHKYVIHENEKQLLPLFNQMDLAISSPSVTFWELAAAGIPSIVVEIAENQRGVADYASRLQLALSLGKYTDVQETDILNAVAFFEKKQNREEYSLRCQQTIDGKGAERLTDALLKAYHELLDNSQIIFKKPDSNPESSDSKLLWEWRNDSTTRQMSRVSTPILWEDHKSWYASAVKDAKKVIVIASVRGISICMIRFDFESDHKAEISINVNPTMRGRGLGRLVLYEACKYGFNKLQLTQIDAEIKPENTFSIKIFEDVGFEYQGERDGLRFYTLKKLVSLGKMA